MKLVRWNPMQDIVSSFHREFDPIFNDSFFSDRGFPLRRTFEQTWCPAVDLEERENEVILNAELPGMKKSDIELSVEGNLLTLRGEKKEERKEGDKESDFYRSERFYGKFERPFTLPTTVEADKARADFRDGVLTITLPKKEEAKSRKISIN